MDRKVFHPHAVTKEAHAGVLGDWSGNRHSLIACLLLLGFRGLAVARRNVVTRVLSYPFWAGYKVYSQLLLNIELSPKTKVGPGLKLPHPYGIIINERAVIGAGCTIRHGVTIGNKGGVSAECPVLGNGVDIGCNAVIIGGITIGDGARIGAGAVVVKDVPAGAVCVGTPARVIETQTTVPGMEGDQT